MVRLARFAFDDDQEADEFTAGESLNDWDDAVFEIPPPNATKTPQVQHNRPGTRRVTRCSGRSSQERDHGYPPGVAGGLSEPDRKS